MAAKITPRKRIPADTTEFNRHLLTSAKEISPKLADMLETRLRLYDDDLEAGIKQLRDHTFITKTSHAGRTFTLYNALVTSIAAVQNDGGNKEFSYIVGGQYADAKTARSLDYWVKCNPALSDAVECIMFELTQGDWSPKLLLPETANIINPETDEYTEPCSVCLICDFTE